MYNRTPTNMSDLHETNRHRWFLSFLEIAITSYSELGLAVDSPSADSTKLHRRDRIQGSGSTVHFCGLLLIFLQISGDSTHLFGDGFAFWLTTERVSAGPVFGNKSSLSSPPKSTTHLA